jgi:hypothetical protein
MGAVAEGSISLRKAPEDIGWHSVSRQTGWTGRVIAPRACHIIHRSCRLSRSSRDKYEIQHQFSVWTKEMQTPYPESFCSVKWGAWEIYGLVKSSFRFLQHPSKTAVAAGEISFLRTDTRCQAKQNLQRCHLALGRNYWPQSCSKPPLLFTPLGWKKRSSQAKESRCYHVTEATFLTSPVFLSNYSLDDGPILVYVR